MSFPRGTKIGYHFRNQLKAGYVVGPDNNMSGHFIIQPMGNVSSIFFIGPVKVTFDP